MLLDTKVRICWEYFPFPNLILMNAINTPWRIRVVLACVTVQEKLGISSRTLHESWLIFSHIAASICTRIWRNPNLSSRIISKRIYGDLNPVLRCVILEAPFCMNQASNIRMRLYSQRSRTHFIAAYLIVTAKPQDSLTHQEICFTLPIYFS